MTFLSLWDYEGHYQSCHTNICRECKRVFPTKHMLELHLSECHDVFFDLMSKVAEMIHIHYTHIPCAHLVEAIIVSLFHGAVQDVV